MFPAKKDKPVTFPGTFRAAFIFICFPLALTLVGAGSTYFVLPTHKTQNIEAISMMTGIMTALLIVVLTSRVTIDDNGIVERWLVSKNVTPWDKVGVVDKIHRGGIAIKNSAGRNLHLITLLGYPVQEAIAEEAIRRGNLRKETDAKVLKKLRGQAIVEQWKK